MSASPSQRDRRDLPLSTVSHVAAEHYREGVERLLSMNAGADRSFAAAVEADPGFALARADLAFAHFYRRETAAAQAAVQQVAALSGGISRREQQHVSVVSALINGELVRAEALLQEHLAEFPRDAVVGQVGVALINASGRQHRREELLAHTERLAPHLGDDWWLLSARAFAHHELDRFEEARDFAERALRLNPRTANGAHALSHVYYETADYGGGSTFLDPWLGEYDRAAPFRSHLSWHLALFELAVGNETRVMEVYERSISPAAGHQRNTLEDSASLLWRLQIYGRASGELPWAEVCDYATRLLPKPGLAFLDAHAALAYAAMGDDRALGKLVDGLRDLAAAGDSLAEEVVLPLTLGVRAFAQADYDETIRRFEPIGERLVRLGGSHAQLEVFEDTLLQSYMRTGRWEQAEALLRRRLDQRSSPRDLVWLEETVASKGSAA